MRRIREVLYYKFEHRMSLEKIAGALRISKGSVHNTLSRFKESGLSWPLGPEVTDSKLQECLYPSQSPRCPLPDTGYLEKELRRPHVTLQLLYEEYRQAHSDGLGRSAFYEYFARHRQPEPDLKMVHKGGDKLFVDFSGDGLEYIDRETGEVISVELFVAVWGATSYAYAEALETQGVDEFVPCHVRAFAFFGVVPHGIVPDNLKSAVSKACRYDPVANPLYGQMARHYGTAILPARVRKPKDKAVVESNVLHVQRFILARLRNRTFYSLFEINEAVRELLELFNARPMKDYGGMSRLRRFLELDQPYAKPLPAQRFMITHIKTGIRVAPNYHILYNEHHYSVPWELVRKRVDVYRVGRIIEVYHDGSHVCRHLLAPRNHRYTTVTEHMPPKHRFVRGWSKSWFIFEAGKIGPATAEAVKQIMESKDHVEQGFKASLGVLRFAKVHCPERLEAACARALYFRSATYRSIKEILAQKLDQQPWDEQEKKAQPAVTHANLRGPQYYQTQNKEQYNA